MLLAVDIGNSSIDLGVFGADGNFLMKSKMATVKTKCADEYAVILRGIMSLHSVEPTEIDGSILVSVVPPLTSVIASAVERLFGIRPLIVGPGVKTGLNIKIDSQAQLGADLVANAVATLGICTLPAVIVDIGTATTFTVLDGKGTLCGAAIVPGLRVSLDALSSRASELPDVSLSSPRRLIAKNTDDAMNSGVIYGHAFMIDGFLEGIRRELGEEEPLCVVATGGLASLVLPHCTHKMNAFPDLTLKGAYLLFQKNRK